MAEAFFLAAAANAVGTMMTDYFVKPIERCIHYLFRFKTVVKRLEQQKKKLMTEQTRIRNEVKEAKLQMQTQVIEDSVDEWLANAEKALEGVHSLERRIEENQRCFRWCPNWSWRYRLSEEMDKERLYIVNLVENSKFERYGHRSELPGLEFFPSKDFVPSESSTAAFNKIMEALKDEKVNMIRVWGMGGVGKTTLVNQVGSKVKEGQLFNRVVQVVVSQTPMIKNIQEKIRDFLDLKFEKMTEEGRAEELWLGLKNEEKVLIILDDMWNELDLKQIGLPLVENGKGCKIILTTRRKPVCESMECQVNVPIDVMDGDEAWTLFKMKANLDEWVSRDIVKEAQKVAKECKGLPVAIITVARALKATRNRKGWEVARKKLETSRFMEIGNIAEDEKNAYKCIKLSYEHVKKETTKICLLLCALYREDHSLNVEDLVRSAWGLGLYKSDSIGDARTEISDAIDHLKDSCLLLEDTKSHVKLHDVVRDVVLWIASKEESDFLIKSRVESLDEISSQSCRAISLLNYGEKRFPERLVYPKLEILLLNNCNIPGTCFQRMNELKVLSLTVADNSTTVISLYALTFLPKLRALHLENFEDLSFLGNLSTTLEILTLRGSGFKGLADELGKLENLKMLGLMVFGGSSTFPSNVIRRLSNLEELYLDLLLMGEEGDDILAEIKFLTRLTALSLSEYGFHFIEHFEFLKLERYDIRERWHVPCSYHLTERSWRIRKHIVSRLISLLPENLESLEVTDSTDEFVVCFSDKTQQKVSVPVILQNLKQVTIRNCENLKVVFQTEKVEENGTPPLLSSLKLLQLNGLCNLSRIWDLPSRHASLKSLVELRIRNCPSLKTVFPNSLAQSLVVLEILEISSCSGLKQIFDDSEQVISSSSSSSINPHNASECFPELRQLTIKDCADLEYIFPKSMMPQGLQFLRLLRHCEFSNCPRLTHLVEGYSSREEEVQSVSSLKHLKLFAADYKNLVPEVNKDGLNGLTSFDLSYCPDLECLVDTRTKTAPTSSAFTHLEKLVIKHMNGLENLCKGPPPQVFLENLRWLHVHYCSNIVSLSPTGKLKNLRKLDVRDCSNLQVVFQMDDDDDRLVEESQEKPLSNLQSLELRGLTELKWLFKGSAHCFSLQSLKVLYMNGCNSMEYLFSLSLAQSLVLLEELRIELCYELKAVFRPEPGNDGENTYSPPLCLPKLKTLSIRWCEKLEYVVPITLAQRLPALESVSLYLCKGLKQVFFGMPKEQDGAVLLPNLKYMHLIGSIEMTSIVPENYIAKAPALKCLKIYMCPNVRNFPLKEVNKQLRLEGVSLPLLADSVCNSEDLTLYCVHDCKTLVPDLVDPESLEKLTSLHIINWRDTESLVDTSSSTAHKAFLQNLKEMRIFDCANMWHVFRIDDLRYDRNGNQAPPILLNLEYLELNLLPSLISVINVPTLYVNLESLKVLKIARCRCLTSLFSVSVLGTLSSLEELMIKECEKLISVFAELGKDYDDDGTESNGATLCLPHLKTVEITSCPSLEYVFPVDSARGFPRLRKVQLVDLRKFRDFVAGNDFVEAPDLEILHVSRCPNFSFQKQVNNRVPLKELSFNMEGIDGEDAESCNMVNSSYSRQTSPNFEYITVGKFEQVLLQLQGGYLISNLEKMTLDKMNGLQHIWKGPIHVATNIRELQVHDCSNLTYIFPVTLIRYLPQLCILKVTSCGNLKRVIAHDETSASSSSSSSQDIWKGRIHVATNLTQVEVHDCNNLIYIFPVMLIRYLQHLCFLKMTSCDNLKQIISHDDSLASSSQDPRLEMKMVFPRLKRIEFEDLSSLESFSPVGYHLVFPCLELLKIKQYFKMITTFTVDYVSLTVHAKTDQASHSQLDDTNPSQEVIYWNRRIYSLLPPFVEEEEAQEILPLK